MAKLITCLGYNLQSDNSVHPILVNRLKDTVEQCRKNKNSILLLMGSSPFQNSENSVVSEASAMKKYLLSNFNNLPKDIKILTEETTTSTVEQLCYLKKFVETKKLNYPDIIIISSEFFGDRVKLYVEYVFGTTQGIIFVESSIPKDSIAEFKKIEEVKIQQAKTWLKDYKKGDDKTILAEQKVFQNKVIKGKIKYLIS